MDGIGHPERGTVWDGTCDLQCHIALGSGEIGGTFQMLGRLPAGLRLRGGGNQQDRAGDLAIIRQRAILPEGRTDLLLVFRQQALFQAAIRQFTHLCKYDLLDLRGPELAHLLL